MTHVITANFVGYGPVSAELEERFRQRTGRKYAFAVSSGRHALLLALQALDLPRPSIISIPVLTCASVLAAIHSAGYRAWLADIDEHNLTINPQTISPDSAAIVAPHAYGAPVDVAALQRLGLPWIEDCATSPATTADDAGRPAGAVGTLAIFSLSSTKYITGGTGGMVVTDDDRLATRIADLLDSDRVQTVKHETGYVPSLAGHMVDLNAAVALVQLGRLDEFCAKRRAIAAIYQTELNPAFTLPPSDPRHSYYRYIVWVAHQSAELSAALLKQGIDARPSVNPWLDQYKNILGGPWPAADHWRDHLLSLPIYPGLSTTDARSVIRAIDTLLLTAYR